MFRNKQVHDSLLILLKGAIRDERFVTDSKKFGIDWIGHCITSQRVKSDLKSLMNETFVKDKRVVHTSVEILKYFVTNPATKEMTKNICQKVCLTDDVLKAVAT
jgi:hypothetical protein